MATPLDSPETIAVHSRAIRKNKFLFRVYRDFYRRIREISVPEGIAVEIGSGGGFLKELVPDLITSDIVPGQGIDRVFSATDIPFPDKSVAVFYLLNVFHHIKDPRKALNEMFRCLKPGGKIIMLEPYNSWFGRFFYRYVHYEGFDPAADWKIPGDGRLSDANNAIPWIIFVRDRVLFERDFPDLKIKKIIPHTPFAYLISGGMNHHSFLPSAFYPAIRFMEKLLDRFCDSFGMFVTIELEKQERLDGENK